MPLTTIENIKEQIKSNILLDEKNKTIILDLLETLKHEIAELSVEKEEHAMFITGFVEQTTKEVLQPEPDSIFLKLSIDGLTASVIGFETTHPKLVRTVNSIASTLAGMGI